MFRRVKVALSVMNQPPKSSFEYWVRFVCAGFVFGTLGGINALLLADSFAVNTLVVAWGVVTLTAALIAARVGDAAWRYLFQFFS